MKLIHQIDSLTARLVWCAAGAWPRLVLGLVGTLAALASGLPLAWAALVAGLLLDLLLAVLAARQGIVGRCARMVLSIDLALSLAGLSTIPVMALGAAAGAAAGWFSAIVAILGLAAAYAAWLRQRANDEYQQAC